ncbi:MAG: YqgE/AlgH family protein [Myxococcaceae bacterium]
MLLPAVHQNEKLAPGLLVAMPQLADPNFHRAVVLMVEHSVGGAMGIVLNRAAPLTLKDVAEGQSLNLANSRGREPVFLGGPVEPQRGFVLHDSKDVGERLEVLPGLYLSVTLDALQPLLEGSNHRVRFCLGYAGWGPMQLEQEIAQGAWLFAEASPDYALTNEPKQLWDTVLRGMGVDPSMIVAGQGTGSRGLN